MLTALFLLTVLTTAATTSHTALTSEVRDVIDKYLTQKITELEAERIRDVQRLTDRVTEVEAMRDRDVQMFVTRIQEVEDKHANDARVFNKRIQEVLKLRAKDVQPFSQSLQEMADMRAKDMETFTKRITDVDSRDSNDIAILSNRLTEIRNPLTRGDDKSTTNRKAEDEHTHTGGAQNIALLNRTRDLKREKPKATCLGTLEKRDVSVNIENSDKNDSLNDSDERQFDTDVGTGRLEFGSPERLQRVAPDDGVAFHAVISSEVTNPTNGHIIQFQIVNTNIGGSYHPTTGVFTCVRPGIYVFSWSLRIDSGPGHGVNTQIIHNGVEFGRSSVGSGGSDDVFSQSSATAAIHLTHGDEVWIRVHSIYTGTNIKGNYSMFTGFLVHE